MAIDLRSDTVTRPSERMRRAAAEADVGDDVYRDDPTVNELERRAADLVGMEAALYVPTGTMGNQVAVRTHTDRGEELLLDEQAHIYKWELGGAAQLASLQTRIVDSAAAPVLRADEASESGDGSVDAGEHCVPSPAQIREGYVAEDLHRPGTGLLAVENTHNSRGGVAVPKAVIDAAADAAHDLDVPVHMDGARLFNACVALDVDPEAMVERVDTVMFCLSKGLGAPVGSMLAGPEAFIDRARRARKLFGGGMRQAGLVAAPGLVALENVDRLAEDHANAARLSAGLNEVPGLHSAEPDTNIVMLDTTEAPLSAKELSARCKDEGVKFHPFGEEVCRLCTHLDVDAEDVDEAVATVERVVEAA